MDTGLADDPPTVAQGRPFGPVRVHAPARLHLGFLDPAGTLGRRFGSLGLAIDGLDTVVELGPGPADSFETFPGGAAALERTRGFIETLRRVTGQRAALRLNLRSAVPAHVGLGSGTQLALAVGRAFCTAFDLDLTSTQLAVLLARGARSGVGVASFDQGGLLLDGGPQANGTPAALLARIAMPPAWRAIVVLDSRVQGLHGPAEQAALVDLAPLPREAAAEICHQVLMRILPGAAGAEFAPFAAGVSRVQEVLGQHFAPAQGGHSFTSAAVGRLLQWIARHGTAGIGQSSWGPTGFAFLSSEEEARRLLAAAGAAGVVAPELEILVIRARNHGAMVFDVRPMG